MTTTVFITRCCKKAKAGLAAWLLAAICTWVLALAMPAAAQQADVTQLRIERTDEGVVLSAGVRFELPPIVDDALAKGIPMFFVAEATILQDRWYWADKRVAYAVRHFRLSHQPLTRRWRLQVSNAPIGGAGLALGQNFDTREEALAAIQRIVNWKVAEPGELDPDARHYLEFRFRLDVSQLPRPFQIGAVGQSEWNISTGRNVRIVPETAR